MSIDKSLKRKGGLTKQRCVLTRAERIAKMMENGAFGDRSPYGLPKTRVAKVVLKKKVKKEAAEGESAAGATPAAGAAATPAAKPPAKK